MNSTTSRPKKSRSSKVRRNGARAVPARSTSAKSKRVGLSHARLISNPLRTGTVRAPAKTSLRQEFRAWRASLPTALERDTLLMPDAIAESVVQEAERFLKADLPANFAERLAARAHHLYPRHKHFRKGLNRRGNGGRETLYMFMRHWTAGWLKRERSALYKKLPQSFGNGQRLPVTAPAGRSIIPPRRTW